MPVISDNLFLETAVRTPTSEDAIRLQSYRIWQQDGCPFGDELKHWEQARILVQAKSEADYQKYFAR